MAAVVDRAADRQGARRDLKKPVAAEHERKRHAVAPLGIGDRRAEHRGIAGEGTAAVEGHGPETRCPAGKSLTGVEAVKPPRTRVSIAGFGATPAAQFAALLKFPVALPFQVGLLTVML